MSSLRVYDMALQLLSRLSAQFNMVESECNARYVYVEYEQLTA